MPDPLPETDLLPNPHPGEILIEEFMKPIGLSRSALARAINVTPRRISGIIQGRSAVTPDIDQRLGRYFGMSEGFFLGLQEDHDLLLKPSSALEKGP